MATFPTPTWLTWAALVCSMLIPASRGEAEVTDEHREQLREIKADLTKVGSHLRRKNLDEAAQLLESAQTRLAELISAAAVEETDRQLLGVPQLLLTQQKAPGTGPRADTRRAGRDWSQFFPGGRPDSGRKLPRLSRDERSSSRAESGDVRRHEAGGAQWAAGHATLRPHQSADGGADSLR